MNKPLILPEGPNKQAIEFFIMFSRFEYALKDAGFYKPNQMDAEADWDAFAKSIQGMLENREPSSVKAAIDYMLKEPPKKQVIKDGKLDWKDTPLDFFLEQKLLIYIKRVRNNLFHGGKFNGHWFAPRRSEELICHSLIILRQCLEKSEQVKEAFEQSEN